jgi:hypothetical protein
LACDNHAEAFARVVDAKMLEKLKTLNATGFKIGETTIDQAFCIQTQEEMRGRHSEQEIELLKRYGFGGGLTRRQRR